MAIAGGSDSEPYGIAITNDGEVWYSESGVKPNTLVRFDPKSESFGTMPSRPGAEWFGTRWRLVTGVSTWPAAE